VGDRATPGELEKLKCVPVSALAYSQQICLKTTPKSQLMCRDLTPWWWITSRVLRETDSQCQFLCVLKTALSAILHPEHDDICEWQFTVKLKGLFLLILPDFV
jgi:hypothetical protein